MQDRLRQGRWRSGREEGRGGTRKGNVGAHYRKYVCTTKRINHSPPMIPTWAQINGGQIFSACTFSVVFDAEANSDEVLLAEAV